MIPLLALSISAIVALVVFRSTRRVFTYADDPAVAAPFSGFHPEIEPFDVESARPRRTASSAHRHLGVDDARIRAELATLADYLAERESAR